MAERAATRQPRIAPSDVGAFVGPDGKSLPVPAELPNAHMRLFGGAQYHRAMAEFRLGMGELVCPDISREEIVNACGVDDFHDGVNYTRTACVIAVAKARDIFEPFLHQVGPNFRGSTRVRAAHESQNSFANQEIPGIDYRCYDVL